MTRRKTPLATQEDVDVHGTSSRLGQSRRLPEDITKVIAQRIAKLRATHKPRLSQRQAAVKIGITQGALSQLESGAKLPSLATLLRIQAAYDLGSLEEIFGDLPSRSLGRRADDERHA